jgi:GSH-dependent disulfide-bond oxidoreductase
LAKGSLYESEEFLQVQEYKHVQRWAELIAQRPAVKRGGMVNRARGEPDGQMLERHGASDFDNIKQDSI